MRKFLLFLAVIPSAALAFTDSDLDGVEDSVDRCPRTPLFVKVDKYGCPIKKRGIFYFKVGLAHTEDSRFNNTLTNVTFGYSYRRFYFSLTTKYYINDSIRNKSGLGDTYLFGSYSFYWKKLFINPGLSIKLPTASDNFGTGNVDFIPSLTLDYLINKKFDAFFYYGYVFRGSDKVGDNYTVSVGGGYKVAKPIYASLSLDTDKNGSNYLSFFGIYRFTKKYYTTLNYSHGLNNKAVDHYISMKLGVKF
ncbi:thrombospondin type 3 repeat-containing protein [Persephonella atlantica]|uniref:thrombospondin type 3 repeat-containing protein n=1 Tax=Persephonella atlantica TaxID=2699429 RepID=UPI00190DF084|nr:thrombospondin type 3 repeat-containing protein [Persephonella atlantica]